MYAREHQLGIAIPAAIVAAPGIAKQGVGIVRDIGGFIGGLFGGGGGSSPQQLCPGTPPGVAPLLASAIRRNAGVRSPLDQALVRLAGQHGSVRKDLAKYEAQMGNPDVYAQVAVWIAWGAGDCKVGQNEAPVQHIIMQIAGQEQNVLEAERAQSAQRPAPAASPLLQGGAGGLPLLLGAALLLPRLLGD